MSHPRRASVVIAVAATLVSAAGAAVAQVTAAAPPTVVPTNDAPNPYQTIEGYAKLPAGRTWGSTSAVDIDKDGVSIWVAERCGVNSCRDSLTVDPIMKFDATGKMLTSFGKGLLNFPHGIHVDRDGNIWVTDGQDNKLRAGRGGVMPTPQPGQKFHPPEALRGHQVYKFSPDGKLLLTLGTAGGDTAAGFFYQPNDVMVAPNGEIYVAEGHSSAATATGRILKFDRNGKFIESWGKRGAGPGEWDQPHALAMDSRGRIFVADRGNNRLVILDPSGKILDTWYQFSRISGLWIDKDDMIYAADSESGSVSRPRTDWKRGIRIGSAKDGKVIAFIPDPEPAPPSTSSAEGVAVDKNGVIYGAEVGQRALKRYVKK